MSYFKTTIWDFEIEVKYDYTPYDKGDYFTPPTPESVEVYEYKFIGETPDFENDVDRSWLEEKIEEAVLEHERRECVDVNVLRPYLRAKSRHRKGC